VSVVHRADGVPPGSREEYWRHVIGEVVGRLEPVAGLPDRIAACAVGVLGVGDVSASEPGLARRTHVHLRSSDPHVLKIDLVASGRVVVEQGGREADLGPGDFTLVDGARPATWTMPGPTRIVAVTFPRSLLPLRDRSLARLTGAPVKGDRGVPALVSSIARQLPAHADDWGASGGARAGTALLDLLVAAVAEDLPDARSSESGPRALLLRIHAFIEEHLPDPALSPAGIAAAHHISVRYLHRLFEGEETTVAAWIRRRRLERCRRDLLDPALASVPAYAIGERWGLHGAARFNRTFRAAFGMPPAEFRATPPPSRRRQASAVRASRPGSRRRTGGSPG
jgi:AraC-like DNA-binding protein